MKKGFTLLELLIVIGILAILSTTMILVINPAELLKKARDSQRISDLNTLKTAIAYYLTNASTISMGSTAQTFSSYGAGITCSPWTVSTSSVTSLAIDGSGWVPIPFNAITGGSPIGALPRDPNQSTTIGTTNYFYVYLTTSTNNGYEMIANMESAYYSSSGGAGAVESNDGGLDPTLYEVGTYFGLTSSNATSTTCFGLNS